MPAQSPNFAYLKCHISSIITDNLWDYAYHIRLRGRSCKQKNRIRLYGKSQSIWLCGAAGFGLVFSFLVFSIFLGFGAALVGLR